MAEAWGGEELRQAGVHTNLAVGEDGIGGGGVGAVPGRGGEADSMEGTTVPWRGVSLTPRTLPDLGNEEEDDCVEVLSPEQAALRAAMGGDLPINTLAKKDQPPEAKRPRVGGGLPDFGGGGGGGGDIPHHDLTRQDSDQLLPTPRPEHLHRTGAPLSVYPPTSSPPRPSLFGASEDVPPPWVQTLQQGMHGMLSKQDTLQHSVGKLSGDMVQLGQELQQHSQRLDVMQGTLQHHNVLHERAMEKIQDLETQVADAVTQSQLRDLESQVMELKELEQQVRRLQEQVRTAGTPRGGLTPRGSGSSKDTEMDLQIVVGGWKSAPKHLAEKEARSLFQVCKIRDAVESMWTPFARTNFLRITLKFPPGIDTLQAQRSFQMDTLKLLRRDKWKSNVPGSEGSVLWVARHRSPEERHKIRAILQTKEFCDRLRPYNPAAPHQSSEFDWRGNVYVGRSQLLLSPLSPVGGLGHPSDVQLTDARGAHTGWAVSAVKFAEATGYSPDQLPQLWLERSTTRE